MLQALEANLSDPQYCASLTEHLEACLSWLHPEANPAFAIIGQMLQEADNPQLLMSLTAPLLDAYHLKTNTPELSIERYDGLKAEAGQVPHPLTLILENLRSAFNVGAIFRTAECLQVEHIYCCGITPTPVHSKVQKTSMNCCDKLLWSYETETLTAVRACRSARLPVLALETASRSQSLPDYPPRQRVALIVGNEALGISEEVLAMADTIISIPVYGRKNSLNVASAFAIAGYWLSGCLKGE